MRRSTSSTGSWNTWTTPGGDGPIRVRLAGDEAADAGAGGEGQVGGSVSSADPKRAPKTVAGKLTATCGRKAVRRFTAIESGVMTCDSLGSDPSAAILQHAIQR